MRNTRLVLVLAVAVCAVIIALLLPRRDDRGIRHPTSGAGGTSNVVQSAAVVAHHVEGAPESEDAPTERVATHLATQISDSELVRLEPGHPKPAHITRAQEEGARARITFLVVDDRGHPVPDATVAGGFYNHGRGDHSFSRQTRSDGTVELEDLCVWEINYHVEKPGYYETRDRYDFYKIGFDCVKNGRWIPWNPTVEVVLKRKINPIAMYAFDYTANYTVIPKIGEPLGFDLMAGDWVAPHGTGKTPDFRVTYFRDGEGRDFTHQELVLTADGPFAGFKKIRSDTYSAFKSPHHADTNDVYAQELRFTFDRPGGIGRYVDGRMTAEECIVFRSRTRIDEDGRLVGAHYGKIYGPLKFATSLRGPGSMKPLFYLNPTENDTNLEYDPRRNLLYPKAGNSPP